MAQDSNGLVWSEPFTIEPKWLDYNGHLNMAYYHVMFDRTVDVALDVLDLGETYRHRADAGIFNVETHVVYRREVRGDHTVRVSFQLLGRDAKRLHAFQTMVIDGEDGLAATSESLFVHVDLGARRSAPFSEAAMAQCDEMIRAQGHAGMPEMAGRRIAPLAP
ncbi:MAG: thioesterase family protein [Pseudomonadota bacterium]